jgi:hypothetical protein
MASLQKECKKPFHPQAPAQSVLIRLRTGALSTSTNIVWVSPNYARLSMCQSKVNINPINAII